MRLILVLSALVVAACTQTNQKKPGALVVQHTFFCRILSQHCDRTARILLIIFCATVRWLYCFRPQHKHPHTHVRHSHRCE